MSRRILPYRLQCWKHALILWLVLIICSRSFVGHVNYIFNFPGIPNSNHLLIMMISAWLVVPTVCCIGLAARGNIFELCQTATRCTHREWYPPVITHDLLERMICQHTSMLNAIFVGESRKGQWLFMMADHGDYEYRYYTSKLLMTRQVSLFWLLYELDQLYQQTTFLMVVAVIPVVPVIPVCWFSCWFVWLL